MLRPGSGAERNDSKNARAALNRDAMVYPTVRDLVESGYLDCRQEVVEGQREHVCRMTEKGREAYVTGAKAWERMR
jgi:DNA-binding PadR family transcriptional regulator